MVIEANGEVKVKWDRGGTSYFRRNKIGQCSARRNETVGPKAVECLNDTIKYGKYAASVQRSLS